MKICAAQTRPITGDIQGNIDSHKKLIGLAVSDGAELITFPELSLTGYEPALARELATDQDDSRFDDFQTISDTKRITIGVGVPTKKGDSICISMLVFQPHQERRTYSKSYLHPDEEPFFVRGRSSPHLQVNQTEVALAICYEISIREHLESALKFRSGIYVASVAKFVNGITKARERLTTIARDCSMTVLMSNCVGFSDGCQWAGKTSVWNHEGSLIGQLNNSDTGILVYDTDTQRLIERMISVDKR
jgi:predicted amidohydrolase